MTSLPTIVDEAESFLRDQVAELTQVRDGECLCCYVARLLDDSPCDGSLRHAVRYRDMVAPRATALRDRLGQVGGFCDCEIFLNGYELPGSGRDDAVDPDYERDDDVDIVALLAPDTESIPEPLPACQGVRRGSVKPCGNWIRIRRW